jgi:hypothetical protein
MPEDLVGLPEFMVGVFCSLDVPIDRERFRGDRKIGLAESRCDTIHAGRHYDYVVVKSSANEIDCGQSVLDWLKGGLTSIAFPGKCVKRFAVIEGRLVSARNGSPPQGRKGLDVGFSAGPSQARCRCGYTIGVAFSGAAVHRVLIELGKVALATRVHFCRGYG